MSDRRVTTDGRTVDLVEHRPARAAVLGVGIEPGTPPERRYSLKVLNAASPVRAVVAAPRSKTRPIMVLVLGLAATLALVLILENLKPRLREVRADAERAA